MREGLPLSHFRDTEGDWINKNRQQLTHFIQNHPLEL